MTKREAEEYLVALRPKPVFASSIRKTPSRPQEQAASPRPTRPQATTSRPAPRVSPSIWTSRSTRRTCRESVHGDSKGRRSGAARLLGKKLVRARFPRKSKELAPATSLLTRREISQPSLSSSQSFERREGLWGRVHPREDRGLSAKAFAERPRRPIVASDLPHHPSREGSETRPSDSVPIRPYSPL
jgi:hypothetical protein